MSGKHWLPTRTLILVFCTTGYPLSAVGRQPADDDAVKPAAAASDNFTGAAVVRRAPIARREQTWSPADGESYRTVPGRIASVRNGQALVTYRGDFRALDHQRVDTVRKYALGDYRVGTVRVLSARAGQATCSWDPGARSPRVGDVVQLKCVAAGRGAVLDSAPAANGIVTKVAAWKSALPSLNPVSIPGVATAVFETEDSPSATGASSPIRRAVEYLRGRIAPE